MKNIKISFFYAICIVTSIFGTDNIAPSSFSIRDQHGPIFEIIVDEKQKPIQMNWPANPGEHVSTSSSFKIRKRLEYQYLEPKLSSAAQNILALENEHAFLQCLENNMLNSAPGVSRLPKTCEDAAVAFAICFGYFTLEEKIADYNKTRELLHPKK